MLTPNDYAKKANYHQPSWQYSAMEVSNLSILVTDEGLGENLKQIIDTRSLYKIEKKIRDNNFNRFILQRCDKLENSLDNISFGIREIKNFLMRMVGEEKRMRSTEEDNKYELFIDYTIYFLKNKFRVDIGMKFVQEELKDIEFLHDDDGILNFLITVKSKKGKLIYQLIESANDLSLIIGKPIMLSIKEE